MPEMTIQQAFDLALQHHQAGRLNEAESIYRQILSVDPRHADTLHHLGVIAHQAGSYEFAVDLIRQAIARQPDYPAAHNNLGIALFEKQRFDDAIAAYLQAIALKPDYPVAYYNLGNARFNKGHLDEAVAAYRKAITFLTDYYDAHNNLGNALSDKGQLDEAIASYREAMVLRPSCVVAHSNLITTLHFHPGFDARAITEELRRWNQRHAVPLRPFIQPHANDRTPKRRLRIGYVSPDFRDHVIGYNMLPLMTHHNPQDFEVFCYSGIARPDAFTERFRGCVSHWRGTEGLTDERLASLIRADEIDILVDLTLHLDHHRLLVFAIKPAPVQVTFAGYPGSTGLDLIDYRLSDPYLDPPGMDESIYSEKTVRLSHSFWCYDPLDCRDVPVSALPANANGFVTFGCLNNLCKVNDSVLLLWAGVLRAIPSSRLLLLAPAGSHRQHILETLRQEGIAIERIEFVAQQPRREYLELYHCIDLGLDTLPYNGHTTSLDSLWMGVPVVTLVGHTVVGRAGLCQSMNLGLPDMIAQSPEEFVRIAVGLAGDIPRLTQLRSNLRQRMEQSPLMDGEGFARDIESAYQEMWRKWCNRIESPPCP